jgi:integrase
VSTPHDLRRTAGSWMLQRGVPIEVVSRMLGHASKATTERVYAHHTVEWLRDAARALEG